MSFASPKRFCKSTQPEEMSKSGAPPPGSGLDGLLTWVNSNLITTFVSDFSDSWADGGAMAELSAVLTGGSADWQTALRLASLERSTSLSNLWMCHHTSMWLTWALEASQGRLWLPISV